MARHAELKEMIEILRVASVRIKIEEEFFRSAVQESAGEVAKGLLAEIADDFHRLRRDVELRKQKVEQALAELTALKTRDPVCDMRVDEAQCKYVSTYKGTEYYFCAPGCKAAFDRAPEKYVKR